MCISVRRRVRKAIASNKENDPISLTIVNKVFPINYRSTLLGHAQSFMKKEFQCSLFEVILLFLAAITMSKLCSFFIFSYKKCVLKKVLSLLLTKF